MEQSVVCQATLLSPIESKEADSSPFPAPRTSPLFPAGSPHCQRNPGSSHEMPPPLFQTGLDSFVVKRDAARAYDSVSQCVCTYLFIILILIGLRGPLTLRRRRGPSGLRPGMACTEHSTKCHTVTQQTNRQRRKGTDRETPGHSWVRMDESILGISWG